MPVLVPPYERLGFDQAKVLLKGPLLLGELVERRLGTVERVANLGGGGWLGSLPGCGRLGHRSGTGDELGFDGHDDMSERLGDGMVERQGIWVTGRLCRLSLLIGSILARLGRVGRVRLDKVEDLSSLLNVQLCLFDAQLNGGNCILTLFLVAGQLDNLIRRLVGQLDRIVSKKAPGRDDGRVAREHAVLVLLLGDARLAHALEMGEHLCRDDLARIHHARTGRNVFAIKGGNVSRAGQAGHPIGARHGTIRLVALGRGDDRIRQGVVHARLELHIGWNEPEGLAACRHPLDERHAYHP